MLSLSATHHREREDARLAAPIPCVGFCVVTAITDNIGRVTYQHSPIYRSEADALDICTGNMPRQLHVWERSIARTVQPCRTCFPLSDVLAGKATRWDDYVASMPELQTARAA